MTESEVRLAAFAGGTLRALAVICLALGGLCSCGVLVMRFDFPNEDALKEWSTPIEFFVASTVLWLGGSWLRRRAQQAENSLKDRRQ
jgi:hypothetical protein